MEHTESGIAVPINRRQSSRSYSPTTNENLISQLKLNRRYADLSNPNRLEYKSNPDRREYKSNPDRMGHTSNPDRLKYKSNPDRLEYKLTEQNVYTKPSIGQKSNIPHEKPTTHIPTSSNEKKVLSKGDMENELYRMYGGNLNNKITQKSDDVIQATNLKKKLTPEDMQKEIFRMYGHNSDKFSSTDSKKESPQNSSPNHNVPQTNFKSSKPPMIKNKLTPEDLEKEIIRMYGHDKDKVPSADNTKESLQKSSPNNNVVLSAFKTSKPLTIKKPLSEEEMQKEILRMYGGVDTKKTVGNDKSSLETSSGNVSSNSTRNNNTANTRTGQYPSPAAAKVLTPEDMERELQRMYGIRDAAQKNQFNETGKSHSSLTKPKPNEGISPANWGHNSQNFLDNIEKGPEVMYSICDTAATNRVIDREKTLDSVMTKQKKIEKISPVDMSHNSSQIQKKILSPTDMEKEIQRMYGIKTLQTGQVDNKNIHPNTYEKNTLTPEVHKTMDSSAPAMKTKKVFTPEDMENELKRMYGGLPPQ